jgi:hypothetical protein
VVRFIGEILGPEPDAVSVVPLPGRPAPIDPA